MVMIPNTNTCRSNLDHKSVWFSVQYPEPVSYLTNLLFCEPNKMGV